MKTGSYSKTKKALKGIALFSAMALFPVAVLLAGPGPLNKDQILLKKRENSVREWRGMKGEVTTILKKADQLKNYRAIN